MPRVEGQGTDKEQQRQDGLIASDVEGPPTAEDTNTQVSTGPDHTEDYTEWTSHSVESNDELLFFFLFSLRANMKIKLS